MKLVQKGERGIEIKLSRRNIEQLLGVLDDGEWGLKLHKTVKVSDSEYYQIVIGVEGNENHYNEDGVAE
jgi:hypothetical protein